MKKVTVYRPVRGEYTEKKSRFIADLTYAETEEEALYFLEDVCAMVCDTKKEVIDYMRDELDAYGMSDEEILEAEEVFKLDDGRYMIVEG